MDYIIREAVGIELYPKNMNREAGFSPSKSCKPLICSLKDCRKALSHDSKAGFSVGPNRSVHTSLFRYSFRAVRNAYKRDEIKPSDRGQFSLMGPIG